jgi:hypothetical protein
MASSMLLQYVQRRDEGQLPRFPGCQKSMVARAEVGRSIVLQPHRDNGDAARRLT